MTNNKRRIEDPNYLNNKYFNFKMNYKWCRKLKTGLCPIETLTVDEIMQYKYKDTNCDWKSSDELCIYLAKEYLSNKMCMYNDNECSWGSPISIDKCTCNHYKIDDGQHRICCSSKLIKKTSNFKFVLFEGDFPMLCSHCIREEKEKKEKKKYNWWVRLFNRREFNEYIERNKEYHEFFHFWKL